MRVRFSGPSGEAVARARMGIGDEVVLGLEGGRWEDDPEKGRTPGNGVGGELWFGGRLEMRIVRAGGEDVVLRVNEEVGTEQHDGQLNGARGEDKDKSRAGVLSTPAPKGVIGLRRGVQDGHTFASPAFAKRLRLSVESQLDSEYDPFGIEAAARGGQDGGQRLSFGGNKSWRYLEKSPSPTKETCDEPDAPVQQLNGELSVPNDGGDKMLPPPLPRLAVPVDESEDDQSSTLESRPNDPLTPKLLPVKSPTLPLPSPFPTDVAKTHFGRTQLSPEGQDATTRGVVQVQTIRETQPEDDFIMQETTNDEVLSDTEPDTDNEDMLDCGFTELASENIVHDTEDDEMIEPDVTLRQEKSLVEHSESRQKPEVVEDTEDDADGIHDERTAPSEPITPEKPQTHDRPSMFGFDGASSAPTSTHRTPQSEKDRVMARTFRSLFGFARSPEAEETTAEPPADEPESPTPNGATVFVVPESAPLEQVPVQDVEEQPRSTAPDVELSELARARFAAAETRLEEVKEVTQDAILKDAVVEDAADGLGEVIPVVLDIAAADEGLVTAPSVHAKGVEVIDLSSDSEDESEGEAPSPAVDDTQALVQEEFVDPTLGIMPEEHYASGAIGSEEESEDDSRGVPDMGAWQGTRDDVEVPAVNPATMHYQQQTSNLASSEEEIEDDGQLSEVEAPAMATQNDVEVTETTDVTTQEQYEVIDIASSSDEDEDESEPLEARRGEVSTQQDVEALEAMYDLAQQPQSSGFALDNQELVQAREDVVFTRSSEIQITRRSEDMDMRDLSHDAEVVTFHDTYDAVTTGMVQNGTLIASEELSGVASNVLDIMDSHGEASSGRLETTEAELEPSSLLRVPQRSPSEELSHPVLPAVSEEIETTHRETIQAPSYPSLPLSPSNSQSLQGMLSQTTTFLAPHGTTHTTMPPTPQLTQATSDSALEQMVEDGIIEDALASQQTNAEPQEHLLKQGIEGEPSASQQTNAEDHMDAPLVDGEAEVPTTTKKTPARKSISNRISNVPNVISAWFSPKRSNGVVGANDDHLPQAPAKTKAKEHPTAQEQHKDASPLVPVHSNGVSTSLSYFTPLSRLDACLNPSNSQSYGAGTVDIFAVVIDKTKEPTRAKSGPRDYNTIFRISDTSIQSASSVRVEVFRPWKATLPVAEVGDVILLRDFKVKSRKRQAYLLSTDASAWCVWRYHAANVAESNADKPAWARKATEQSGNAVREEVKGPPVEFGEEERGHARSLRLWWEAGSEASVDEERNGTSMEDIGTNGHLPEPVSAKL